MKMKLLSAKTVGFCLVALLLAETLVLLVEATNGSEGQRADNPREGRQRGKNGRKRKNKDRQRQQQQQQQQKQQFSDDSSHFSSLTDSADESPSSSSFLDSNPVVFANQGGYSPQSQSQSQSQFSFEDHPGHPGHISSSSSSSSSSSEHSASDDADFLMLSMHHPHLPPPPPPTHTCEPIRIDLCRHIGYNVTSMPNFVGHELQTDGELQLNTFLPLINYGCSSQLKFFLCSVYVPMCTEKVPVTIGPCRPLCESVRSRCAPVLEELGFPWPEALNCSQFVPTNSVDQMCMDGPPPDYIEAVGPPPTIVTVGEGHGRVNPINPAGKYPMNPKSVPSHHHPGYVSPPVKPGVILHPHSHEVLLPPSSSKDQSAFNYPTSYQGHSPTDDQQQQPKEGRKSANQYQQNHRHRNSCDYLFKSDQYVFLESSFLLGQSTSSSSELPTTSTSFTTFDHPQCVPKCSANILFSEENKQFVDYWTAVWAALAVLSCALTLAAFFAHSSTTSASSASSPASTAAVTSASPVVLPSGKVVLPPPAATSAAPPSSAFRYPERAVVYIAVCSGLSALAYLYRGAVGRQAASCHLTELPDAASGLESGSNTASSAAWLLVSEAAYNPHCTASFLLLYYFGMAASAWFTVLAATLSGAVAFRLRLADLSARRSLYHCFAWCLPAAQTLAALVLRAVDGDELTGVCFVGGQSRRHLLMLVLLPSAAYLGLATVLLLASLLFARLVAVREVDQCSCTAGNSSESGPFLLEVANTNEAASGLQLFTGSGNLEENLPTASSETQSETTEQSSGCSRFCRRFRRASAEDQTKALFPSSGDSHISHHHHQATSGSGHSLLLPSQPPGSNSHHFCTVSSTSSYSSSATSSSSATAGQHVNARVGGSGGSSSAATSATSKPPYSSLVNSHPGSNNFARASLRTSKRHSNSRTPAGGKRSRHYHLRRNLASSSSGTGAKGSHLFTTSSGKKCFPNENCSEFDPETAAALIRSAIFALFYLLPAACVTAGYAYEYLYRDSWLIKPMEAGVATSPSEGASSSSSEVAISSGVKSTQTSSPNFEVFNMRLFMSLVIGINTGIWILTAKSPIKGSWWWSSSSTSGGCLFWRCFVKKGVPLATNGSVVSSVAPTASIISGNGGNGGAIYSGGPGSVISSGTGGSHPVNHHQQLQTTLPVYPMMSHHHHHHHLHHQQQPQTMGIVQQQRVFREPQRATPASNQAAAFHQLQLTNSHLLQQQNYGLQPNPVTNFTQQQQSDGSFFFLSDLAGSVPTGSTGTNSTLLSSLANSNGQQQPQQFFSPVDQQTGVQSLWSQPAPTAARAPGNETAV